jgi:hypothetical protein
MPPGATGYVEMPAAAGFEGAVAGSFVFADQSWPQLISIEPGEIRGQDSEIDGTHGVPGTDDALVDLVDTTAGNPLD